MASEKNILRVLDMLTMRPTARAKTLGLKSDGVMHRNSMRSILDSKNVIAVGISEKIAHKKKTGKLALTFYVAKKIPLEKLKGHEVIPPTVPEPLSGKTAVPTDVVVLGKLKPEVNATRQFFQPGNSIGHIDTGAGTFGAVVKSQTNELFILSNSHVLAECGRAILGDEILYPGSIDGGVSPADTRATLRAFIPFDTTGNFINLVDCALAQPTAAQLGSLVSAIRDLGLPTGVAQAKRGMKVTKVGRTSGTTTGEVLDVNFRFVLDYRKVGLRKVGYKDQVLCTRFTAEGDSGSLVIDQETGKAIGLHFAGAPEGSVSNPINEVLTALAVNLVTTPLPLAQGLQRGLATKRKAAKTKGKAMKSVVTKILKKKKRGRKSGQRKKRA